VDCLVKIHWRKWNQIEFYLMVLDEHHTWKAMIWFPRCSLSFPSNFEMCEGILDGIGSHVAWCKMGSLEGFIKYIIYIEITYMINWLHLRWAHMVVDYFPYFLTIGNQPPSDFLEHMNLIMLIQIGRIQVMLCSKVNLCGNVKLG
jgi:hypothetical protein